MWYVAFSLIAVIAISLEKSSRNKLGYLGLALCFPTVAYSLWRVNSERKANSKLSPVLRLGFWFSISHTVLTAFWLINTLYINTDSQANPLTIIMLWAISISFSILTGIYGNAKKYNGLNQSAI